MQLLGISKSNCDGAGAGGAAERFLAFFFALLLRRARLIPMRRAVFAPRFMRRRASYGGPPRLQLLATAQFGVVINLQRNSSSRNLEWKNEASQSHSLLELLTVCGAQLVTDPASQLCPRIPCSWLTTECMYCITLHYASTSFYPLFRHSPSAGSHQSRSTYKDTATRILVREPPVAGGAAGGRTDGRGRDGGPWPGRSSGEATHCGTAPAHAAFVRARLQQARGGADRRRGRHVGSPPATELGRVSCRVSSALRTR